jgi:hypothetical protein
VVFLQIGLLQAVVMRRETARVSFLMCPLCVRVPVSILTTALEGFHGRVESMRMGAYPPLG